MKKVYLPPEVSDSTEVLHMKMWEGTINDYVGSYTGTLSGGTGTPTRVSRGFAFDPAKTQYIDVGACFNGVKTISLWIKQDDVAGNEYPIDLNGTDYLSVESGVVTVNGLAGHSLYVDGAAGTSGVTTINAWWHLITITDATANNASDFDIGRADIGPAVYYGGIISDVRLYSVVRTAIQVRDFYNKTKWRYGV